MITEDIYNQYKRNVFNLALNYTNNIQDAEEVTQDVFIKVVDKMGEFRQDSELNTWIYRITINKSLDYIKSKQRQKRSFIFSQIDSHKKIDNNQVTDYFHPGIELEIKESLKYLMRKIHQLPENQKTVIILLKIEDMSQKEVAEIMKLSEGAVESLFQRAKATLKKMLKTKDNIRI